MTLTTRVLLMTATIVCGALWARSQSPESLDLTAVGKDPRWKIAGRTASIVDIKGKHALKLSEGKGMGVVWLDGYDFADGIIEIDILGRNQPFQGSFVGVAFRVVDEKTHDVVYFRPFNFRAADAARHNHAVQYVSHPRWPWQTLRSEHPDEYERAVVPEPDGDEWFHVRVVVERPKVDVFVNGASAPSLSVKELSDRTNGSLGLWVGEGSGGHFANLRVTRSRKVAAVYPTGNVETSWWAQFRGPEGGGAGNDMAKPPSELGPTKDLSWKTALPVGHGSPCIWSDRIFVTGFNKTINQLELIALDRASGKVLWRRQAPSTEIETVHQVSSPATSTPASDGQRVYVYYGSVGLLAYEWDGAPAWEFRMPVAKSPYGSGTSPVLAGELVLIGRDYPPQPQLFAVSRKDGKLAWKVDLAPLNRMGPRTAHSTPVVWRDQVLLHRPGEVSAYSLKDGGRLWWVNLNSQGTSSLAATPGAVYVAAFSVIGDPHGVPEYPSFAELLEKYDTNKDGKLSQSELPDRDVFLVKRVGVPDNVPGAHFALKTFFRFVDTNGDGFIDEQEWKALPELIKKFAATQKNTLTAILPGGEGDMTASAVLWQQERSVPEVPSPLFYRGRVYIVANGGIVSCVDAKSGSLLFRGRVGAPGAYYSSPVAADGKVFLASSDGVVTVLADGETLKVLSNNDLGEPVFGTPALVGSGVYVRSLNNLWAFGSGPKP